MDGQARVWVAARIRPNQTAAFCRKGSTHPSAQAFPINQSGRQMQMYDPKTKKVTTIDTCFGTHHLNFDDKDMLWFTGGGPVEGWFNTRIYLETGDEQKAQGWTAFVLDHQRQRQARRLRRAGSSRSIRPRTSGSTRRSTAWRRARSTDRSGARCSACPARSSASCPVPNPPSTALAEVYEVPWNNPKASAQGFAPRGMDVDSNGVVWTVLSSGHSPASIAASARGR